MQRSNIVDVAESLHARGNHLAIPGLQRRTPRAVLPRRRSTRGVRLRIHRWSIFGR